MTNKNVSNKNARFHLSLEAASHEPREATKGSGKQAASTEAWFDESHIKSRRPTRLSLELLSRAKGKRPLPEAEEHVLETEALLNK